MPFHPLAHLANSPLRLALVPAAGEYSLSMAALCSVFQLAARLLAGQRLQCEIVLPSQLSQHSTAFDLLLLVAETDSIAPPELAQVWPHCQQAQYWGALGAAVLWAAQAGQLAGYHAALAWSLHAELDASSDPKLQELDASLNLYELDRRFLSCCGAAASLDFALALVADIYGNNLQARLKEVLCIEHVRAGNEKQRQAELSKNLPPKLSEVLELMQANIEEPLSSDDLANLVNISRRQLERLFKQYLGNLPSRYYLEMRLGQARKLLIESHHSIVQVGLMCGFSSGSHFSTAFSALFGITPREERQRKLKE